MLSNFSVGLDQVGKGWELQYEERKEYKLYFVFVLLEFQKQCYVCIGCYNLEFRGNIIWVIIENYGRGRNRIGEIWIGLWSQYRKCRR